MSGLLFALLATLLAGIGARDQLTVAGIAARAGQRPGLLMVAVLISVATASAAAYGGALLAPLMPNGDARLILASLALALAGGEMLLLKARPMPDEPTQSLGAIAIVLAAHQLTDAVRFLIVAIAVATRAPFPAGLGGALGGACVVLAGWLGAQALPVRQLSLIRRCVGVMLLLVAGYVALKALGQA